MDVRDEITNRFTEAIRLSVRPCPLIGTKWFRFHPKGRPADFQFIGAGKLAKAAGMAAARLADEIVSHLDLGQLDATVEISSDATISLRLRQPIATA